MNRIPTLCTFTSSYEINRGWILILSLFIVILLNACSSPTSQEERPGNKETPEEVAKKWQELVYLNQFEEAKALSTQNAKDWITWIEKMMKADSATDEMGEKEAEIELPIYLEMKCKESGNKATCSYLMKEGSELFRDSFILVKVKNQWLVDIPEEDMEVDESMEKMLQEMENFMKE